MELFDFAMLAGEAFGVDTPVPPNALLM